MTMDPRAARVRGTLRSWWVGAVGVTLLAASLVGLTAAPAQAVVGSWLPVHGGVWNSAGTFGGTVYALASIDDTLYVGGSFGRVGRSDDSIVANNIAAYNMATDTWHAIGAPASPGVTGIGGVGTVFALAVHPVDDTLYLGGSFQTTRDDSLNYVAQWNGGRILPMGPGLNNPVYALALSNLDDTIYATDDTLYIGGAFDQLGTGTGSYRFIAQWADDTYRSLGSGMNRPGFASAPVYSLAMSQDSALNTDDTLYAGGDFTQANGIAVNFIARWYRGAFSAMGQGLVTGGGNVVTAMAAQRDDTVYFGGSINTTNGGGPWPTITLNDVGRWVDDTYLAMGSGLGPGEVKAIAVGRDDSIYFGGGFTANGLNRVAQWSNGAFVSMGNGITDGPVRALVSTDDTVFAGGGFGISSSPTSFRGLAQWAPGVAPTVTLSYQGNTSTGGSPPSVQSGTSGTSVTVSGPGSLVKAGYTFNGWNTAPNGTGIPYAVGSTYTFGGSNANLFAQWIQGSPTPDPTPVYPPSPPLDVSATAGEESVTVTWRAPSSPGSFPVTNYSVTSTPGGRICLVSAPALSCEVDGLTPGTAYTFTVQALNGAGWSPASTPSNSVTPKPSVSPTIMITGERGKGRESRNIYVNGTTTRLAGDVVQAHVRTAGSPDYSDGTTRTVKADETFTWQRRSSRRTYVYFSAEGGTIKSNIIVIAS
ncbi:MAG: hypothetical protein RL134_2074 [Actinomycetota bacterium]